MKIRFLASTLLATTLAVGVAHAKPTSTTLNSGGASSAFAIYSADFKAITGTGTKNLFSYAAAGSGAGQKGFLQNNIDYFEPISASNTVGYAVGTLTYGTIVGTEVDFGASDAYLSSSQLTNAATGSYGTSTEGSAIDGPLVQIPALGVATTLAYNESAISNNGLTLTDAQTCGILSGQITDWNAIDPSIPVGTTINVAVRSDSSGTTFLLTEHLNAVCTASNSAFPEYPVPITKYFYNSSSSASSPVFPNGLPANFVGESGGSGVAKQLVATANSFGYLSPDYTDIAPNSSNTTALQVAAVLNPVNNVAYLPSTANTTLGLNNPGTGSANGTPPASLSAAQDPLNWVPVIPQTSQGYSLVGYTTIEASSCYASATHSKLLLTFLKDLLAVKGVYPTNTANAGFVPLQKTKAGLGYYNAVENDFLSNKSGYNLNIQNATTCASYAGR